MTARKTATAEAPEQAAPVPPLPKRTRATAVREAPPQPAESAPEPPQPAPQQAPKWPPIGPQLDREYPHLTKALPDAFAGLMAFNGMAAAHEALIAEDGRKALDAIAASRAQADGAHEETRARARYIEHDVCAYAAAVGVPVCPVCGTPAGAIWVQGARALTEAAGQHHETGPHPWLDAMALELSTAEDISEPEPAA